MSDDEGGQILPRVPRQYLVTPFEPVTRQLLDGLQEVFAWLRITIEIPFHVVTKILLGREIVLPRGRDWKDRIPRPPPISFEGAPGALWAGGHIYP